MHGVETLYFATAELHLACSRGAGVGTSGRTHSMPGGGASPPKVLYRVVQPAPVESAGDRVTRVVARRRVSRSGKCEIFDLCIVFVPGPGRTAVKSRTPTRHAI